MLKAIRTFEISMAKCDLLSSNWCRIPWNPKCIHGYARQISKRLNLVKIFNVQLLFLRFYWKCGSFRNEKSGGQGNVWSKRQLTPAIDCYRGVRIKETTLQWRHNEHDGVSNHQRLDCLLNRLSANQRNIIAPRHWPLWGEFTGNRWIPRTKVQ